MAGLYKKVKVAVVNSALPEPYNSYGDHWVDGFKDAGCDVTVFPYPEIPYIPPRFDLYFFVEIRYNPATIPWYLNPRVLYSWDSHLMDLNTFHGYSKAYDWILLASKIDVDNLNKGGMANAFWIPEACNPRVHRNLNLERYEKIGFVGNLNSSMARNGLTKNDFIDFLKTGPYGLYHKTHTWGDDYTVEQNKIQVMFDRTITHNIGTRLFESSAAGCVPLWSKTGIDNGIEGLMTENVHYVPYNDTIEDLGSVLDELFQNPERMKKITTAAEKHVLANHTYSHRAEQVLKLVGVQAHKVLDL